MILLQKVKINIKQAYVNTMIDFGITEINQDWKSYPNVTDSHILKLNYEANFNKEFNLSFIPEFEKRMTERMLAL